MQLCVFVKRACLTGQGKCSQLKVLDLAQQEFDGCRGLGLQLSGFTFRQLGHHFSKPGLQCDTSCHALALGTIAIETPHLGFQCMHRMKFNDRCPFELSRLPDPSCSNFVTRCFGVSRIQKCLDPHEYRLSCRPSTHNSNSL